MEEYQAITQEVRGLLKEKGSKFISIATPVQDVEDVKKVLAELRKEFHDARHHCYAYRLAPETDEFRYNDDGEPSGTAGKPIYGQILSFDLHYILIVVVRYFGGILLGTGGLIQAYKGAAKDALSQAEIVKKPIEVPIAVHFGYPLMNEVMRIIKEEGLRIEHQDLMMDAKMWLMAPRARSESALLKFEALNGLTIIRV